MLWDRVWSVIQCVFAAQERLSSNHYKVELGDCIHAHVRHRIPAAWPAHGAKERASTSIGRPKIWGREHGIPRGSFVVLVDFWEVFDV